MDTIKIAHLTGEIIVFSGVIFYFNGQMRGLKNEIKDLKAKLEEQQEVINKHLNNVYGAIDKITRSQYQIPSQPQQLPQAQFAPHDQAGLRRRKKQSDDESPMPQQSKSSQAQASQKSKVQIAQKPSQKTRSRIEPIHEEQEVEPSLDDEIGDELEELERQEDESSFNEESDDVQTSSSSSSSSTVKGILPESQDLSFVQSAIRSSKKN